MIRIHRYNYEEFFIDYIDGNLNVHEIAELILFLVENHDLEKELNSVIEISGLLKNKSLENKKLSLNKKFAEELGKFEKMILKKDLSLKYSYKEKLKKKTKTVFLFNNNLLKYVAVLISFLIGSYFYLLNDNIKTTTKLNYVADNNNKLLFNIIDKKQETKKQKFKIVKRETPFIVSKSINKLQQNQPVIIKTTNRKEFKKLELFTKNNYVDFVKKKGQENNKIEKNNQEFSYIDPYSIANNEINIEEFINHYSSEYRTQEIDSKTLAEGLASFFSEVTSVFKFKSKNIGNKTVYDFALAGKKFEIGRKINKKKK